MQLTSNIDIISHVATAVEVSQGSYVEQSNELVKRQQAHVVIEIEYIINMLNWKTTFIKILLVKILDYSIKILHRQTFAPYGI